ncbi:MAG TPA: MarR family transcriptional regulator [Thermoplasmata archaeon]|nr:MarR family transcriptional regulator [Thermoplasmata archaeon]
METGSPKACAGEVLDTVPLIMQFIRVEMRRSRGPGISVPQFRVLTFLNRTEGASLSAVADRVGLSLPAMSRLVDGLVSRDLVRREESPEDRRRVLLHLTNLGKDLVRTARAGAQSRLAEVLTTLPIAERGDIARAMQSLRPVFLPRPRPSDSREG